MGVEIGPFHVRRSIFIQASPARVWREFESFESLDRWFGRGHELHQFEGKLGGQVQLSVELGGAKQFYGGPVLVWEPEREVTFASNWDGPEAWPVATFFTIRLTPVYEGTLVELFHHGFERLGADAGENLAGYEEGWDVKHLKVLREIVEG